LIGIDIDICLLSSGIGLFLLIIESSFSKMILLDSCLSSLVMIDVCLSLVGVASSFFYLDYAVDSSEF